MSRTNNKTKSMMILISLHNNNTVDDIRCNQLVWDLLSPSPRINDEKFQNIETMVVKSPSVLAKDIEDEAKIGNKMHNGSFRGNSFRGGRAGFRSRFRMRSRGSMRGRGFFQGAPDVDTKNCLRSDEEPSRQ
ncbi:hypothetical protein DPMN_059834 [Dreissena polymorpha]|uniref:Uncharacterized protein n=1 Tax=Dreissena polymorpha TaxID=45954 RepID=A0A9D4C4M0_DREPO|nr:hypothetical protein DPMN_059834 [Dreissena polymorpha]